MSIIHGAWSEQDVRAVLDALDRKTGMDSSGFEIAPYYVYSKEADVSCYFSRSFGSRSFFEFSFLDADLEEKRDLMVIESIRYMYIRFLEEQLQDFFSDYDNNVVHKTLCGILNVRDNRRDKKERHAWDYGSWWDRDCSEETLRLVCRAGDVRRVNIKDHIARFGIDIPSVSEKHALEKKLVTKFSKARVFYLGETVSHKTFGEGLVIDTFPTHTKQLLCVRFADAERIVQNRDVYKVVCGEIRKPAPRMPRVWSEIDEEAELP